MEKPYVPFYKPYGMTDEEYSYEVAQAEQRLSEWEDEQPKPYEQSEKYGDYHQRITDYHNDKFKKENVKQ